MKKKFIATALGAFGFGALVGWAVTADIKEKQIREEREIYEGMIHYKTEHIWALQDRLNRVDGNPFGVIASSANSEVITGTTFVDSRNRILTATGTVIPKEKSIMSELEDLDDEDEDVIPEGETPEETRTNLQKLIDSYVASPEDQETFVEMADAAIKNKNAPPFVISQATYAWDEEGEDYEKISLTYYPRDRVLLDDEEDPVEDIDRLVGWRSLAQFGGDSGDPDVVFVRNRRMSTDFEVIKEEESPLPLHVKYGMEKEEFRANRAAGLIKLRQEDDDN